MKRKHRLLADVFDNNLAKRYSELEDKGKKTTKNSEPDKVQKSVKDYQSLSSGDSHTTHRTLTEPLPL